jgi:hypothetical protein
MELVLRLKKDMLDLLELVQQRQAQKGTPWSDSMASKLCFKHGEFVSNLKKWDGGKASPTLEKTLEFERFLVANLDAKDYAKFMKGKGISVKANEPVGDDW